MTIDNEDRLRELEAQMMTWQRELDVLESRPETRLAQKERIESLRDKLRSGADLLVSVHAGGPLEVP